MNQNIIVYLLISILFILVIYLLKQASEQNSSNNNNNQPPTSTNPAVNLTNYYNKSEINNTIDELRNLINNISLGDSTSDSIKYATFQELGYEINFDNTINFNHPVDFNDNVEFDENISINYDKTLINTLPPGSIIAWNSDTIPKGWALCDGQLYILDSNGHAQVESTGVQTPDLRGRFILGAGQGSRLTNRTLGDTNGAETHTLNVSEMPSHNHSYSSNYTAIDGRAESWPATNNDVSKKYINTGSKGGNSAHNNMPPYYVLTYIMKI
jgi:microcystin-dependent protein